MLRIPIASSGAHRSCQPCLADYFDFYNTERPHQSLEYRTPKEVHCG
jgi:hypothetical protein